MSIEEILEASPGIEKDDILACISYSSHVISRESLLAS
ncbi:PF04255 domain protein [Leptospira yanagawae serovar Saopaulo str. Sao Paulo = ATCC 700523]|nr:PF04255 domain protein [Leptospira yanagawae serovar Saopaulo str. Sao Paulo = ATCC 700523]